MFTVPAGVTAIHATVVGAHGAPLTSSDEGGVGGEGDTVSAELAVATGETLYVEVGGNGATDASGFNGGGGQGGLNKGAVFLEFFGGGGASDIRTCSVVAACSGDTRLIVAGGGGGGAVASSVGTETDSGYNTVTTPGPAGGNAGYPAGLDGGAASSTQYQVEGLITTTASPGVGGGGTGGAGGTSLDEDYTDGGPGTEYSGGGAWGGAGAGGGGDPGGGGGASYFGFGTRSANSDEGASSGGGGADYVSLAALIPGSEATYGPLDSTATPSVSISYDDLSSNAPGAELPETPFAAALPLAFVGLAGGFVALRRRSSK